ncbi:hypothetical protein [Salegentibacter sp. F14]
MKKLFYLIILGAGIIGCSTDTESLTDSNNIQELDFTIENSGFPITTYDYYNNGGKLKGSLLVTQDCDNLYVQITGDPDEVYLGVFDENDNPQVNQNNDKVKYATLPDDLSTADQYQWTFPLSGFSTETVKIFARSWGNWVGDLSYYDASYFTYTLETCEVECESGYMIGSKNFSEIGHSNNWGWAHYFEFEDGQSQTREIHHKNGSLGGEVTFTYSDDQISVEEGNGVKITHLYISDTEPETTNAPGQFDKDQTYEDEDGAFWVMVKAEVCQ